MKKYEWSVVSFYKPSDAKSMEIDALMEGAKLHFDQKIAKGEWSAWSRKSVGWFRIDIDENPDMAYNMGKTDQMITGHGQRKMIGFQLKDQTVKEHEESMAKIVRQFTGDWFTVVSCDKIQHPKRRNYDEVVYFGPRADLARGGAAELFTQLSIIDRYNFDEQFASFLVNEDPSCRTKF